MPRHHPAPENRAKICAECGWTSYPRREPNGTPFTVTWVKPERCGRCGAPLPERQGQPA